MVENHTVNDILEGLRTEWYESGQKKAEVNYKDGKIEGLWTYWDKNDGKEYKGEIERKYGKDGTFFEYPKWRFHHPKRHYTLKNGKYNGLVTLWYENGQKKSETNYKDDKNEGLYTLWYESGQKKSEINYKDGKEDGLRTEWYENGQKKREANSKDGYLEGLSTQWYESGQKNAEKN